MRAQLSTAYTTKKKLLNERGFYLRNKQKQLGCRRRGAAAIFGLFLCAALFVVLAVVADLAYINSARTEIHRSADAAALAAAWELAESKFTDGGNETENINAIAANYSRSNSVGGIAPKLASTEDAVQFGTFAGTDGPFIPTAHLDNANAVRVKVELDGVTQPKVPLFFGGLTGTTSQKLWTYSIASFDHHISGFHSPWNSSQNISILPIALDEETWLKVESNQTVDNYTFENGVVQSGSDGFFECSLYPVGSGSPGNRGTVDIGSSNNSTKDLRRQIIEGISKSDFEALGKPLEFNDNGIIELNGDTGISAGIKSDLEAIIGQTRIIPIFSRLSGNGNNAQYSIVRWEGVRILSVQLTGPAKHKHLTIQSAPIVARGARVDSGKAEASSFLFTPVQLVE